MIAVVNDISFQYPFATSEQAMEYMHRFLDICRRIKISYKFFSCFRKSENLFVK